MSEIKMAESFLKNPKWIAENNWEGTKWKPINKKYYEEAEVIQAMLAYHNQFNISDEEIEKMATGKNGNVSLVEKEVLKKLRNRIFKTDK